MKPRLVGLILLAAVAAALPALSQGVATSPAGDGAQNSVDTGLPAVLEAIHRARITTRILYITAHPDDEAGALLTYVSRGLGAEVALLTLTRGEGGQNAVGPELGGQLAVIRSSELLAATRLYGVQLFFTRAPDFGFSKTMAETLKIWGDTALADMVYVIRTFRPDIVINGWDTVRGGHGNHQASGFLTPKAFAAAADPNAFPEQLSAGLQPWQASLLLQPGRGDDANGWTVPVDDVSPLWGRSYREISIEALANHRSQGLPGFLSSPFLRRGFQLARTDGAKLDPAALAAPPAALAAKFPGFEEFLRAPLDEVDKSLAAANQTALALNWREAARELARAGRQVMRLKTVLAAQWADKPVGAQWELTRMRERIDAALAAVAALRMDARADRGEIVAAENFTVRVDARPRPGVLDEVSNPMLVLPEGWRVAKEEPDAAGGTRFTIVVSKDAKISHVAGEWMLPFPPPLLTAKVRGVLEGYAFEASVPVVTQRVSSTRVEILPLGLVPAVALALEPPQFLLPVNRPAKPLELLARVHSYSSAAAKVMVGLDMPPGWRASPAVEREFTGPGDQLVRFELTPPAKIAAGNYSIGTWAKRDGETFRTALGPLPSMPAYLWSEPATLPVRAFEVAVPENLRVGYVAAETDPIPEALARLGIQVETLDPVALAFGDLRRFDAIVIGIRAYELRSDLLNANPRLLEYAANGGTLVVLYERSFAWDAQKPAPFPATMGQGTLRTTDENSPVRFLLPDHPVLNFPNKISQDDFKGWVQDRGLYYLGRWDAHYQAILAVRDPGEEEMSGSLLYARTGKGVYIYTGLAFFRQLPEGVPGAFRLFVNLLSQSRAKR